MSHSIVKFKAIVSRGEVETWPCVAWQQEPDEFEADARLLLAVKLVTARPAGQKPGFSRWAMISGLENAMLGVMIAASATKTRLFSHPHLTA